MDRRKFFRNGSLFTLGTAVLSPFEGAANVLDLESITLMSDGASIYECTSPDEIVDLLQGGQGVFGIAIGKVWSEVEGSLSSLQGESLEDGSLVVSGESNDELAQRRKLKGA